MKRLVSLLLILTLYVSLCACTGESLDEIQKNIVGDQFVYTRPLETVDFVNLQPGEQYKTAESELLEFYGDGTFSFNTISQNRLYNNGVLDQKSSLSKDYIHKYQGTFELTTKSDKSVTITLHITIKDGKTYNEQKEYTVHMENDLVQSIGRCKSIHYAEQMLLSTGVETLDELNDALAKFK